jgi:hypothetical protein
MEPSSIYKSTLRKPSRHLHYISRFPASAPAAIHPTGFAAGQSAGAAAPGSEGDPSFIARKSAAVGGNRTNATDLCMSGASGVKGGAGSAGKSVAKRTQERDPALKIARNPGNAGKNV